MPSDFKKLFLSSDEGSHTGRSGYPVVAEFIRDVVVCSRPRSTNHTFIRRFFRRILRLGAVSSWYGISSFGLEFFAYRRKKDFALSHLAWADRDWGYLDVVLSRNRPLVGTFHACPDDFSATVTRPSRLKNLSAAILMSEAQRENFLKAGMPLARIHVIHHGIDTKHFVPPENKPVTSRMFVALHVGSYRRNFDDLEAVCKKLSNSSNIRIKIITSPIIGARFAHKANVELVSGLTDDQLLKAYQEADCLLMTAEAATANNAILEGIACGLPVVTQRVGGIPEYVNEDCAILCDPGDADALVSGLEKLRDSSELRAKMGQAARNRALELDWVHVAAKTQAVYDQVLAEMKR